MTLRDWLLFLFGDRAAILRCGRDRRALWIALIAALLGGVFRCHDRVYLGAEPWCALQPVLVFSLLALVAFTLPRRGVELRQFLAMAWLVGSLGWLVAVPFDRLMPAGDAARMHVWSSWLVLVWQALLMLRVVSVWSRVAPLPSRRRPPRVGCWSVVLLVAAYALWIAVEAQPAQRHVHRLARAVAAGDWERAQALMGDATAPYPRRWTPPPADLANPSARGALVTILERTSASMTPRYVQEAFLERMRQWLRVHPPELALGKAEAEDVNRLLALLLRHPSLRPAAEAYVVKLRANRNWLPSGWDRWLVEELLRAW